MSQIRFRIVIFPAAILLAATCWAQNLFITGGQIITEVAPDGTSSTFYTGSYDYGAVITRELAFDNVGVLFAMGDTRSISPSDTVEWFSPDGTPGSFYDGILTGEPAGFEFGPNGNLYLGAYSDGVPGIDEITLGGSLSTFVSLPGDPGYTTPPLSITFAPDGDLYALINTRLSQAIYEITPDGTVTEFAYDITQGLDGVKAIAFGPNGNLYAETAFGYIDEVTPSGSVFQFAHVGSNADGDDGALAFDQYGDLFAVSNYSQIDEITPSGSVSKFTEYPGGGIYSLAFGTPRAVPGPDAAIPAFAAFLSRLRRLRRRQKPLRKRRTL
jgi:hypothetical protein